MAYKLNDGALLGQPTAGQVRDAAKEGSAEAAVKRLFPSAFEQTEPVIGYKTTIARNDSPSIDGRDVIDFIQPRHGGKFHHRGFWLSPAYQWSIEKDELGTTILVVSNK